MSNVKEVLKQRGEVYGSYSKVANVSQDLKTIIKEHLAPTTDNYIKESLDMICNKLARAVCGDPQYLDNWVDICGYSQLIVNELKEKNA